MRSLLIGIMIVLASSVAASAQQNVRSGPYASLGFGYAGTFDAGISDVGSGQGLICGNAACTARGTLNNIGSSGVLEGALGYRFGNLGRGEVSLTHLNGLKLSDQDAAARSYSSNIQATALMVNGFMDIPGSYGGFRPYIGGGVGAAWVDTSDVSVISQGGATTRVFPGQSNTNFAYQAVLGTQVPLTDGAVLDFGVRYFNYGPVNGGAGRPTINGVFNPGFASAPGLTGDVSGMIGVLRTTFTF